MNGRIFLGIDAGSRKHLCIAVNEKKEIVWHQSVSNDHAGCDRILEQVKKWQEEEREIWIAGEGHGGYLSPLDIRLLDAGHRYISVSPVQVCRYRELMGLPPDKNDEKDALHLAELLHWKVEHHLDVRPLIRNEYYENLRDSARGLNQLIANKVALQNQLVDLVRQYWPELMITGSLFARTDSRGLLSLLVKYPTPQAVVHAGLSRVKTLLKKATGGRQRDDVAETLINQARTLLPKIQVASGRAALVQQMAAALLEMETVIQQVETDLKSQLQAHPFGQWLLQQEGIGPRTAGVFLGEAGDMNRFTNDCQLARYAGSGAVHIQSGEQKVRHRDQHCYNHHLKRALMLMANSRFLHHAPSTEYVNRRKQQGQEHWQAIKKLSRHIIRFLWRGWQQCRNESKTLEQMS